MCGVRSRGVRGQGERWVGVAERKTGWEIQLVSPSDEGLRKHFGHVRPWGPEQEDTEEPKRSFHPTPSLGNVLSPWPMLAASLQGYCPLTRPVSSLPQLEVVSWIWLKFFQLSSKPPFLQLF